MELKFYTFWINFGSFSKVMEGGTYSPPQGNDACNTLINMN